MKRIRVSDLAERDLDEIWYFIAKSSGSIDIADCVIESVQGIFALLGHSPEIGTKRDWIDTGLRGYPAENTSSITARKPDTL